MVSYVRDRCSNTRGGGASPRGTYTAATCRAVELLQDVRTVQLIGQRITAIVSVSSVPEFEVKFTRLLVSLSDPSKIPPHEQRVGTENSHYAPVVADDGFCVKFVKRAATSCFAFIFIQLANFAGVIVRATGYANMVTLRIQAYQQLP